VRRLQPRHVAFIALAGVVAAACVRLGFWQLSRLAQRRAANALIIERLNAAPIELAQAGTNGTELAYRQVAARGHFDPQGDLLLLNRALAGQPGFHLVTPLVIEGSTQAILVDRGWVPIEAGDPGGTRPYAVSGTISLQAWVDLSEPEPAWSLLADPTPAPGAPPRLTWRSLNIERIQPQIKHDLLPFYLVQTQPLPGHDLPQPVSEIDLSEGPHLGYAIQWFAFGLIALGGAGAWVRSLLRRQAGSMEEDHR
jgi:surfeit locus 1 family protein